jgi:hypothetical protein
MSGYVFTLGHPRLRTVAAQESPDARFDLAVETVLG